MKLRLTIWVTLLFFSLPLHLFAIDNKVMILENPHNDLTSESTLLNQLCSKYFTKVGFNFSANSLSGFDVNVLFLKSGIIARKTCFENNCDYLLIPASLPLGNNMIRERLILYEYSSSAFVDIYDDIISVLDVDEYVEDNIIKVFEYFGLEDAGIIVFPEKEYGYSVMLEDVALGDKEVVYSGVKTLRIMAEGYKMLEKSITIKPRELNYLDFDLEREEYSNLFISTDGLMYNAKSSEIGEFTLPFYMDKYSTPSSISFSYPGFETKYISLTNDISHINISLKPEYLSHDNYSKIAVNDFYKAILLTLGSFALDVASRSLLNENPGSDFLKFSQNTFSNLAYFSLGVVFFKMIDYYFSSVYAFK